MNVIEKFTGRKSIHGDSKDEPSPYGIPEDYFMSVEKAKKAGFEVKPLKDWMPSLIQELCELV